MPKKVELEIEINEKGEVKAKVEGEKGAKCLDWMRLLENALGPVREKTLTSEYYEVEEKVKTDIKTRR